MEDEVSLLPQKRSNNLEIHVVEDVLSRLHIDVEGECVGTSGPCRTLSLTTCSKPLSLGFVNSR